MTMIAGPLASSSSVATIYRRLAARAGSSREGSKAATFIAAFRLVA